MKTTILIFLYLFTNYILARPVSYPGSWTLQSFNDDKSNSLLIHYSPTSKYSIGYKIEYWDKKEYLINAMNVNYLIKRINKKGSQFNLYSKTGLGFISTNFKEFKNKNELVYFEEISTDWETRSLFTSYSIKALKSNTLDTLKRTYSNNKNSSKMSKQLFSSLSSTIVLSFSK